MNAPKLVIGANGFLGSHVTRQLVADCAPQKGEVRAMVRPAANTRSIDDLPLTRFHGDVFDTATVAEAMAGCDDVYYCVVDTRAWLRDPSRCFAPMWQACATSSMWPQTPACAGSSSPAVMRRWVVGVDTWRPKKTGWIPAR